MPNNFSQADRTRLLRRLGRGKSNAIGARRLAQLVNYPIGGNQVRLRGLIKECIEIDGDLIGASTGKPAGFFIISTLQELEIYLDSLGNRTRIIDEHPLFTVGITIKFIAQTNVNLLFNNG
jgi:hypothetical protein